MKLLIVLCLVAAIAADFAEYQKRFGKKYETADLATKAQAYYDRNQKIITEHNAKFAAGEFSYSAGENQFTDQNITEVIAKLCRTMPPENMQALPVAPNYQPGAPSRDYSSIMQPVVDQGQCGACWAFATVAQLESLYKSNSPSYDFVLSPQCLVDCDRKNNGCDGGTPSLAMEYIKINGLPLSASYPYTGVQKACKSPLPPSVTPKLGNHIFEYDPKKDETLLKDIVSAEGPVVIAIYVTDNFVQYKSGVFYDGNCPTNNAVNHAVVVVGYGTDAVGGDYWMVRNSWGPRWGLNGYIKMARNRNNNCCIACFAWFMKK